MPVGTSWISGSITSTAITASSDYYIGIYSSNDVNGRVSIMTDGTSTSWLDTTSGTYASPPSVLSSLSNGGATLLFYADGTTGGGSFKPYLYTPTLVTY